MDAAIGYPHLQPVATDDSILPPRAREKILRLLEVADTHLQPKIIALRTGIKHNTVKSELRRLAHSHMVVRDETGYFLPSCEFERQLEKELRYNGQKESLPRVHDIHLTFKVENIRKLLSQPNTDVEFRALSEYVFEDRGPEPLGDGKTLICGCTRIASLSSSDVVEQLFDPREAGSLYRLWENSLPEGGWAKKLKGGFQETVRFGDWKLIVQFYTTGTIKVIFSNSEHPFDALGIGKALSAADGVFLAKTGIGFMSIASLFYVEKVHIGSDILLDREFSGAARFCCTVKELDRWMFRSYEKVLGGMLYVRGEACMEGGSFGGSHINALLRMVERQTMPTQGDLMLFRYEKRIGELEAYCDRLGRSHADMGGRLSKICASGALTSSSPVGNPFRIKKNEKKEIREEFTK